MPMQMKSGPATVLEPIARRPIFRVASEKLGAGHELVLEVLDQNGFGALAQLQLGVRGLAIVARWKLAALLLRIGAQIKQNLPPRLLRLVREVLEQDVAELHLRSMLLP